MQGRSKAARRESERELWAAYHTGLFAAAAQAGKLKPLKSYWASLFGERNDPASLLGAFMALKDRGVPMNIKKLN